MEHSHLKMVSIGIVARDKVDGEKNIEVYPMELIPFFEGKVTDEIHTSERSGVDAEGKAYTVNLNKSMVVTAEWLGETNRRTAPNVVVNEQVQLYQVGNSGHYYWESLGRDDEKRRRERVIYTWASSSTPITEDGQLTDKNTYNLEIDTIGKTITLRTSEDDEEFTTYVIQINTKAGHITAMDGLGNIIQVDSAATKITLKNADNTFITLDKEDINAYAPQDIAARADRDVSISAGRDMYIDVGVDMMTNVGEDQDLNVGGDQTTAIEGDQSATIGGNKTTSVTGDYTVDAMNIEVVAEAAIDVTCATFKMLASASIDFEAATISAKAGTITLTGAVLIGGSLAMGAGGGSGGGGDGAAVFEGTVTFQDTFACDGVATFNSDVVIAGNVDITGITDMTSFACSSGTVSGDITAGTYSGNPIALLLLDT